MVLCRGLVSVLSAWVRGGSSTRRTPGPLKDREAIAKLRFPPGVRSRARSSWDPISGSSSKTVEEALASLQAYVRDNVIFDGGLGQEIRIRSEGDKERQDVSDKSGKKAKTPTTVIVLSRSGS